MSTAFGLYLSIFLLIPSFFEVSTKMLFSYWVSFSSALSPPSPLPLSLSLLFFLSRTYSYRLNCFVVLELIKSLNSKVCSITSRFHESHFESASVICHSDVLALMSHNIIYYIHSHLFLSKRIHFRSFFSLS